MNDEVTKILTKLELDSKEFEQEEAVRLIKAPMNATWTVVYDVTGEPSNSTHIFSCFAKPELKEHILSGQSWLKHAGAFCPGFEMAGDDVSYFSGIEDGFEYIVAELYYHTLEESQLHLNNEFILLLGLYRDADGNYYTVDECGEKNCVVRFEPDRINVKTSCLLSYMAAKQLLFVQFVDSRVSTPGHYPHDAERLDLRKYRENSCNYFVCYNSNAARDYLFSMIHARSVVDPPAVEECGIWPYEKDEEYPEFIVEELPNGEYKRFTCDESKLGNYFGGNPGAPHYLTPVYFKPDVLDKYRKNHVFSVSEYELECGTAWALPLDNVYPSRVMAFLGDLGTYLPESERKHFLAYEMSPDDEHISVDVIAQSFGNMQIEGTGPVYRLLAARRQLDEAWFKAFRTTLYRAYHPKDASLEQRLRVPDKNDMVEFENALGIMAIIFNDYINQGQFKEIKLDGSLNKLGEFLNQQGIAGDLEPLRNLQGLRSKGVAHAKNSDYDKLFNKLCSGDYETDALTIMGEITCCLETLALNVDAYRENNI